MSLKRIGFLVGALALLALGTAHGETPRRSGYSYIREISGEATVDSRWNGQVDARRNMPISAGDELSTGERTRVEIALADGAVLHVGGGSRVRFLRLRGQEGEEDDFSAIDLKSGSIVLAASSTDEGAIPRIDTDDATIYLSSGSRARVNADGRHGTVVVTRYGSAEVRTRAGTQTVKAGSFLEVNGEQEPEVARGTFSRDRFDIWSADRFDLAADAHSAASRYVDEEYGSDVSVLDGYGDWSYNNTYSSYVWSPRVAAGWSPYTSGCWYYTPVGLTWWSSEPWGYFPHHYGNWFWDGGWNRWCWSPASVYSPAWVYWGFSSGYVGWCPIGWYSGYSPWWDSYYKHWNVGVGRGGLYFAVHGNFATRTVDLRGWNFAGAGAVGSAGGRIDVIPGSRIGDRLGSNIAVSSRTIVVNARDGGGREAIQNYIREAPRVIDRAGGDDSTRMAPVLGRQRDLPPASVDALRDRVVLPARGRLQGPGVEDLSPRGASVDRSRTLAEPRGREAVPIDRGRSADPPARPSVRTSVGDDSRRRELTVPAQDWRDRGRSSQAGQAAAPAPQAPSPAPSGEGRPVVTRSDRGNDSWRSRPDEMPPARRVIEGAVPGRRRESRADETGAPREYRRGRDPEAPRSYRQDRPDMAPQRQSPARIEPRPAAPPPAHSAPAAPPPHIEPRQAPAPPAHSAPAPAPVRRPGA